MKKGKNMEHFSGEGWRDGGMFMRCNQKLSLC